MAEPGTVTHVVEVAARLAAVAAEHAAAARVGTASAVSAANPGVPSPPPA